MKKLTMLFAVLMAISLTACSQSEKKKGTKMKTLVAYFSASGVTEGVAKQIVEVTGADLFKIQPEQPYTEADLDWTNKQSRSSLEMQDKTSRPAIAGKVENMADYDVVYLGFPIWWYTCPTIINTFVEAHELAGKTVIPFATSGGSTITQACKDLKNAYPNVDWTEGRLLNNATRQDIETWVR